MYQPMEYIYETVARIAHESGEPHKFNPDYRVSAGEVLGEWLDSQDINYVLAKKLERLTGIKVGMWRKLAKDKTLDLRWRNS